MPKRIPLQNCDYLPVRPTSNSLSDFARVHKKCQDCKKDYITTNASNRCPLCSKIRQRLMSKLWNEKRRKAGRKG